MITDAQTAKWQARYGRDPTDQQRAWLVKKVRTDIAMRATKLNAQVPGQLTNLRTMCAHMYDSERGTATSPDQRRQRDLESVTDYEDWARLQGRPTDWAMRLPSCLPVGRRQCTDGHMPSVLVVSAVKCSTSESLYATHTITCQP